MDISSNEVTDDLVSACKEHSSRIAIDGEGVSVSYGNLLAEATCLGQRLRESGAGESTSVMVKCSNHPSDFVALLGVWIAGAAAIPVHRTSRRMSWLVFRPKRNAWERSICWRDNGQRALPRWGYANAQRKKESACSKSSIGDLYVGLYWAAQRCGDFA